MLLSGRANESPILPSSSSRVPWLFLALCFSPLNLKLVCQLPGKTWLVFWLELHWSYRTIWGKPDIFALLSLFHVCPTFFRVCHCVIGSLCGDIGNVSVYLFVKFGIILKFCFKKSVIENLVNIFMHTWKFCCRKCLLLK